MKDEEMMQPNSPLYSPSGLFFRTGILLSASTKMGRTAINSVQNIIHPQNVITSVEQLINKGNLTLKSKAQLNKEKKQAEQEKLNKLVSRSQEVLAHAKTVFPFDLFPDSITVDRAKITIVKRTFVWSAEVMSIRIEDVLNVSASLGPFFGSLTIVSRVMSSEDHFKTNYFWRKDAIMLKHLIQGYVIAQHNNIEIAHLPRKKLVSTLMELGHDSNS